MHRAARFVLGFAIAFGWSAARAEDSANAKAPTKNPAARANFEKDISPLVKQFCARCHSGAKAKGDIAFDKYQDETAVLRDRSVWERAAQAIREHEMPPGSRPQPSESQARTMIGWIEATLGSGDCSTKRDPGRVTMRRLNRVEYNNTIRDLVGVLFQPADDFPADDVGYGFDNIGDVLTLPPILMEKYLAAAERIVSEAMATPALRRRLLVGDWQASDKTPAARKTIETFGRRAYRRPLQEFEIQRLLHFVTLAESQGDGAEKGIELALEAMLTSPHFLFRVERDRRPRDPLAVHPINEFELASRLSYFLWSSMPDDGLLKLAQEGKLRKEGVLEAQVQRMVRDPKSRALVENFAGQWLQLRNLRNSAPDPVLFPSFDEALRSAMIRESELFFENILRENRSIFEFIDSDYTFVNERLARHYGISGVKGDAFQRVSLKGTPRGGVLTQASILTLTSNPTRTSPVKRGKWILENILGTPPPPPPPDAGELSEDKAVVLSGSLRKRMEQHRANPNCAVCHDRMDAIGFGFENFDAIGGLRNKDGAFIIDPSGVLPGGRSFQGPQQLREVLKSQKEAFRRSLIEKMLTYALGRGLEPYDRCAVDQIAAALAKKEDRMAALLTEVVKSEPFQMRRGQKGEQK